MTTDVQANLSAFASLEKMLARFEELEKLIVNPEVMQEQARYRELVKERGDLYRVVTAYRKFKTVDKEFKDVGVMASEEEDEELVALAQEELGRLEKARAQALDELKELLVSEDVSAPKSVIMEIRAGTGGEEASLFAADLFRMYGHYAEKHQWKVELLGSRPTELGGYKEVILSLAGADVYGKLRFESGGHRVKRVPVTESQGRIHTSACTVAVLPEVEEVEVEIKPEDIHIDTFRSSGPGGQHVNKTSSAVRITHLPTGLVVSCQDEKSQHKNRSKAMRVLRARLYEQKQREQQTRRAAQRRSQIGSGDRSERIRTYNFPQNRVTDHRIGLSLYTLQNILMGELDELVAQLSEHYKEQRLKELKWD